MDNHKILLSLLMIFGLVATVPVHKDRIIIDKSDYPKSFIIYSGEHDIVKITVPINALNFEPIDRTSNYTDVDDGVILFFVEADRDENGKKDYKGLYVLRNDSPKLLLENGRDIAASSDNSRDVFFAASDGIYVYNYEKNSAEKYGMIVDSFIEIEKENNTDVIYAVNEKHELYKITEQGTKAVKIDDVNKVQQISLDYLNNLYYYSDDRQVYVVNNDGVKKIEGLPENAKEIELIKGPFVIPHGVPVIADDTPYLIYSNGTSEMTEFEFKTKPTAYSMEATLLQYYAHDKKIYEYNILGLIFSNILSGIKKFLTDKIDSINNLAGKTRQEAISQLL